MIGFILYLIGIILCIKAVIEILNLSISIVGKAITIVLLLSTSWLGLLVYYFYAKKHLTEWFK
jgi:hypothetical protein